MQKVLIGVVALLLFSACGYSTLKTKDQQSDTAWTDLGFSCRQRIELAATYIATVERHLPAKNQVITQAENALKKAGHEGCPLTPPETSEKLARFRLAQTELTQALAQLHILTCDHQDLQRDLDFLAVQKRMEQAENRINEAITGYNFASHEFNVSKRSFPHSLTNALLLRYKDKEPFMGEESVKLAYRLDS